MTISTGISLAAAGAFWWTLLEYLLHRWAFHTKGRLVGRRHLAHHARTAERRLALAPLPSSLGGAAIHAVVCFGFFGAAHGGALFGGFLAGYVAYEWVHYSTHYRPARTAAGRWLRAYHLLHHHRTPKARFGVTSPLWDLLFGTYAPVHARAKASVK